MSSVLEDVKALEARGFSFEAAEASVAMMLKRLQPGHCAPFELVDFLVNVEHRSGRGLFAEAMVKVRVDGELLHTAAEGNGPVDALDAALRKALRGHYPRIDELHLCDYKVRILDGQNGTGAITRVLIDMQWCGAPLEHRRREPEHHRGVAGVALVDGIEYGLTVAGAGERPAKGAEAATSKTALERAAGEKRA